jgi:hypothetical protein
MKNFFGGAKGQEGYATYKEPPKPKAAAPAPAVPPPRPSAPITAEKVKSPFAYPPAAGAAEPSGLDSWTPPAPAPGPAPAPAPAADPQMEKAIAAQVEMRKLRHMNEAGPAHRRLGEAHPKLHPQRLQTEREILADLEAEILDRECLESEAANAKVEYENELRDLLAEAAGAFEALRALHPPSAFTPAMPASPPQHRSHSPTFAVHGAPQDTAH